MALAEPQVLGDGPHGDVLLPVVLADVVHGLEDVLALVSLLKAGQGGLLGPLAGLHPAAQIGHRLLQLPIVEGLEEKVHRPQTQGALGVGEAVVGGEDDDVGLIAPLPQLFQHLDAVHPGHFQIGDDEGGVVALHSLQGLLAVGGLAHHHAVQGGPVHRQDYALADHLLVFYHQYLQHGSSSFRRGRVAVTSVPGPSSRRSR